MPSSLKLFHIYCLTEIDRKFTLNNNLAKGKKKKEKEFEVTDNLKMFRFSVVCPFFNDILDTWCFEKGQFSSELSSSWFRRHRDEFFFIFITLLRFVFVVVDG